jgi:hypothetical protein
MGVYAGQFCWHEEWAAKKVATVVQQEISKVEKQMMGETNPTNPSPEPSTSTPPEPSMSTLPIIREDKEDEPTLHVNVWEDSRYCTRGDGGCFGGGGGVEI